VIELARHLEVLLLKNDCVIVPGFGGFVAHYSEARYESEEQLFLPPLRIIGFNPQLKLNDSLLVLSYTETYDISYPEALRRIEDEVNELRQHLETERYYELNGIGQLTLNPEGNLLFEPCEAGILTPSLYGLGSFTMSPLITKTVEQPLNIKEEQGGSITIRMSWLRNAVAVAAAILAFFFLAPPVAKTLSTDSVSQMGFTVMPGIKMPSQDHAIQKDTTAEVLQTTADADIQKPESALEEEVKATDEAVPANSEDVQSKTSPSFCIVLASQVSRANAEDFVERLKKAGYSHARVCEHHSIRRVVYGYYESQTEAVKELRSIRGSKFFEEAWVMEIKE
jgi:broad-specificity NMP kinase